MRIGREMKNVVDIPDLVADKWPIDIIRKEDKALVSPPFGETRLGPFLRTPESVDRTVEALRIFLHQNVREKAPQQTGGPREKKRSILQLLPRQRGPGDFSDVLKV